MGLELLSENASVTGDWGEASGEDESGNISTTTRLTKPRNVSVPTRKADEQRKFGVQQGCSPERLEILAEHRGSDLELEDFVGALVDAADANVHEMPADTVEGGPAPTA